MTKEYTMPMEPFFIMTKDELCQEYDKIWKAAYAEGYQEGHDEGYAVGLDEGESDGFCKGRDNGYDWGFNDCIDKNYRGDEESGDPEGHTRYEDPRSQISPYREMHEKMNTVSVWSRSLKR